MKRNIDLYDNVLCVCVLWGRGGGGGGRGGGSAEDGEIFNPRRKTAKT